jgi:hypothetical protein
MIGGTKLLGGLIIFTGMIEQVGQALGIYYPIISGAILQEPWE